MEIHTGLKHELVGLALEESFAAVRRERRANEASQGSRQERPGIVRIWLARLGSLTRKADYPRMLSRAAGAHRSAPAR